MISETVLNVLRATHPLGVPMNKEPSSAPEPPLFYGQILCHHNTVWFYTSEHQRMATPGECCREILKERARKNYFRQILMSLGGLTPSQLDHMEELLGKQFASATEDSEIQIPPLEQAQPKQSHG